MYLFRDGPLLGQWTISESVPLEPLRFSAMDEGAAENTLFWGQGTSGIVCLLLRNLSFCWRNSVTLLIRAESEAIVYGQSD